MTRIFIWADENVLRVILGFACNVQFAIREQKRRPVNFDNARPSSGLLSTAIISDDAFEIFKFYDLKKQKCIGNDGATLCSKNNVFR